MPVMHIRWPIRFPPQARATQSAIQGASSAVADPGRCRKVMSLYEAGITLQVLIIVSQARKPRDDGDVTLV